MEPGRAKAAQKMAGSKPVDAAALNSRFLPGADLDAAWHSGLEALTAATIESS